MRRAERLFRLVAALRARDISRADDLARRLEVSKRTIYRDIAHLQGSGLPIDGAAGVGYLLRPGFDLPSVTFTHDQIAALAVGLSFAESLDDPALVAAAGEARAKLQASMPDPGSQSLANAPYFALRRRTGAPGLAGQLRRAIRLQRVVELTYQDGAAQVTVRRVRPLAVWHFDAGWMFSGWCELRDGFRTFRFDRIAGLIVTEDHFAQDPATGLQAFLAQDDCAAAS